MKEGFFDRLDVKLGRWSDSDGTNGKRRRSWGATVFFWLCLPMFFLIACVGISLIITSLAGRGNVPKTLMQAYDKCLKVASKKELCKLPSVTAVTATSSKQVDLGWGPWVGSGLLVVIGFLLSIWRRKQDFDRFVESAKAISVFVQHGKDPPLDVLSAFKGVSEKMLGDLPLPKKEFEDTKSVVVKPLDPH